MTEDSNPSARACEYDLYVVFHGALAFHDLKGSPVIDVYAPYVMPHVYRAGSWLTEYEIRGPRQFLILTGVEAVGQDSSNRIATNPNFIYINAPLVPDRDYRAKIRVPRPSKILCRRIVQAASVGFASGTQTRNWAQVPVFAYKSKDLKGLGLTGRDFAWKPSLEIEPMPLTLHIWATAEYGNEEIGDDDGPARAAELFGERVVIGQGSGLVAGDDIPGIEGERLGEFDLILPNRIERLRLFSAKLRSDPGSKWGSGIMNGLTTCGPVGGGGG